METWVQKNPITCIVHQSQTGSSGMNYKSWMKSIQIISANLLVLSNLFVLYQISIINKLHFIPTPCSLLPFISLYIVIIWVIFEKNYFVSFITDTDTSCVRFLFISQVSEFKRVRQWLKGLKCTCFKYFSQNLYRENNLNELDIKLITYI